MFDRSAFLSIFAGFLGAWMWPFCGLAADETAGEGRRLFTPEVEQINRVLLPTTRFATGQATDSKSETLPLWLSGLRLVAPAMPVSEQLKPSLGWGYRTEFLTPETGRLLVRLWHAGGGDGETLLVSSLSKEGDVIDMELVELGGGSELESGSEVVLDVNGASAIEVTDSPVEARIRQMELVRLETREIWAPRGEKDSLPAPRLYPAKAGEEDRAVRGSVEALLLDSPEILEEGENRVLSLEFEIQRVPEAAMLALEMSGFQPDFLPDGFVNDVRLRALSVPLPGLGDPSYLKLIRPAMEEPVFLFTGWASATAYIPSRLLVPGVNTLTFALPEGASPVRIRHVGLHLKFPSHETQVKVKGWK